MPEINAEYTIIVHVFGRIDEHRHLCIITYWSTVILKLFKRGRALAISWTRCFWSNHKTLDKSLIRMLLYCWLLEEPTSVSKTNQKMFEKIVYSNWPPLIRLVFARNCLWSEPPIWIDLWPDKFQTNVAWSLFQTMYAWIWSGQRSFRSGHLELGKAISKRSNLKT